MVHWKLKANHMTPLAVKGYNHLCLLKITTINGSNDPTRYVLWLIKCNLTPLGPFDPFKRIIPDIDDYTHEQ